MISTTIRGSARCSSPPPWSEVPRLYVLLAQVRRIDTRLNFLYRGRRSPQGEKLLRLMRCWLALHEAAAVILQRPLPLHVEQARVVLQIAETATDIPTGGNRSSTR